MTITDDNISVYQLAMLAVTMGPAKASWNPDEAIHDAVVLLNEAARVLDREHERQLKEKK